MSQALSVARKELARTQTTNDAYRISQVMKGRWKRSLCGIFKKFLVCNLQNYYCICRHILVSSTNFSCCRLAFCSSRDPDGCPDNN